MVPALIPRVALVESHFRARQCRPDTSTGQCVVLGSRLAHQKKKHEITAGVVGAALILILAGALVSGLWFRRLV